MFKLIKSHYKLTLLINVMLFCLLMFLPQKSYAQWPPFRFDLDPTYADGTITYNIDFRSQADWMMSDIVINIPIPEGTRFVKADVLSETQVNFNGTEVSLFTALPSRGRVNGSVIVEVAEPEKTIFSTQAWISWKGDGAGDYLADEISLDITKKPLEWTRPTNVGLDLDMEAMVVGDAVIYGIYVENTQGGTRMWDLKVNVPLPENTTFLSAEAPPPFVTTFNGREVSFFTSELAANLSIPPLRFTISIKGVTSPTLSTHAWASWKNSSRNVIRSVVAFEETATGDVIVQPNTNQQVIADSIGDAAFSNYDVTSVTIQDKGDFFETIFYTAGPTCPIDAPLEFRLYIDSDCQSNTGQPQRGRGADYEMRYRYQSNNSEVRVWDAEEETFQRLREANLNVRADGQSVTMAIPYSLINNSRQFCWVARSRNTSDDFTPNPPTDWIPNNSNKWLGLYAFVATEELVQNIEQGNLASIETTDGTNDPAISDNGDNGSTADDLETANTSNQTKLTSIEESNASSDEQPTKLTTACTVPGATAGPPPPPPEDLQGKLAVPIDNGRALYDVYVFSLPEGQEIARIVNARQPNFHPNGQRLLINREGNGLEDLYEYNLMDGTQRAVSEAPRDAHPVYDPWGNRVAYDNADLTVGAAKIVRDERGRRVINKDKDPEYLYTTRFPFIFVQCGLIPPHQEVEPRCQDIPGLGKLVPANQIGEIIGDHPVWTDDDRIAYRGCNTWAGSRLCGIYLVPSVSTKGFSNGFIPRQLTDHTSDTPSDTRGDLITFTSQRDGNWEAYVVNKDGFGLRNISNSPLSNDGLPVISPDGSWFAFVSDRDGHWSVWAVPVIGGESHKLFDLPNPTPWGDGDRVWLNERISWGP